MENYYPSQPQYDPDWVAAARRRSRSDLTRVGFALLLAMAVTQGLSFVLSLWLQRLNPAYLQNSWILLSVSMLPLYLVGMPLAFLVVRRMPKSVVVQQYPMGVGQFLKFFLVGYAMLYAANILTTVTLSVVEQFKGSPIYNPTEMMLDISLLPSFIYMGLLAPILEEWLFRGVMLRRLLPHGETFAIVTTAVLFGLFHGNFFQMLYACAIGLALGYAMVRTGSLLYSICIHILINVINGVIMPQVLLKGGPVMIGAAGLLVVAMVIAGVVLFIINRKKIYLYPGPPPLSQGQRLGQMIRSPGIICFTLLCIGLSVYLIVLI